MGSIIGVKTGPVATEMRAMEKEVKFFEAEMNCMLKRLQDRSRNVNGDPENQNQDVFGRRSRREPSFGQILRLPRQEGPEDAEEADEDASLRAATGAGRDVRTRFGENRGR